MRLGFRFYHASGFIVLLVLAACSSDDKGGSPVEPDPPPPPPQTGSVRVTTATSGEALDRDVDGFTVVVDTLPPQGIASTGTVNFLALPVGNHIVRLDGAAENCAIEGENPRTVEVGAEATTEVPFAIDCAPGTGLLVVRTFPEGGTDPDGYTISLNEGPTQPIGIADSITFVLSSGDHEVLLAGLASGCSPHGPNPRAVSMRANGGVGVNFHVACPIAGGGGRIAFYNDAGGDWEIFTINADGSNLRQLTDNMAFNESHPSWSSNGAQIAFVGTREDPATGVFHEEVIVMNADGSNQVTVTNHPLYDGSPGWSSGNRIAFQTNRDHPDARPGDDIFPDEIYTINADGTDVRRVTSNSVDDIHPDWSPNGATIVYSSEVSPGNYDILTVAPDGTGIVNLTNHPSTDWRPAWSPDGTRIAFHSNRDGNFEIYVMNVDGTGLRRLTSHPADDFHPAWSPDSRMIAYQSTRAGGDFDIYVMNADGTGVAAITNNTSNDDGPSWTR